MSEHFKAELGANFDSRAFNAYGAAICRLERTLLRIAEEPGTGPEKAAIAWAALKPNEDRT